MIYNVPEVGEIEINNIVLDLNGTLSVNGAIPEGVKERLDNLNESGFTIVLLTGDQRGTAADLCEDLGIDFIKCKKRTRKGRGYGHL